MSGINPERFTLKDHTLTVSTKTLSGSVQVNPSFIKERLGFFESLINRFYSLFSDNYWKAKTVSVQTRAGMEPKIMYILESRLNITFNPISSPQEYQPPTYRSGPGSSTTTSAEKKPLLSQKQPTEAIRPARSDASKAAATSSEPKGFYTDEQIDRIKIANGLFNWVATLSQDSCKIKQNKPYLSVEPKYGVKHEKIENSQSTDDFHILQETFPLLTKLTPDLWKVADYRSNKPLNYDKYRTACQKAIDTIQAKSQRSTDDAINLYLLTASSIIAKGFEEIGSGSKKHLKTFTPDHIQQEVFSTLHAAFNSFGTKLG